jgi:hypothetical protein
LFLVAKKNELGQAKTVESTFLWLASIPGARLRPERPCDEKKSIANAGSNDAIGAGWKCGN